MSTSNRGYRARARIVFVATDLSTGGGVNKVIRDLAILFGRYLSADVSVVNARSDRPSSYAFPPDIPVQSHRHGSILSYFRLLLRLRRTRPDLVVSSWTQDNILVTLAFLFSGSKVVLVEHSSWRFHQTAIRVLRRVVYPLAWRIVVLNSHDLEQFQRRFRRVRLIPNPVIVEHSQPAKREKLILAVGHLHAIKQFDGAIRAFAQSRLAEDGWSMAIVGSGNAKAHLESLITASGLKCVKIHEPTNDIAYWYSRASLLILPSRTESFSLVLAEAMLSGVVPVAYATDGPSFILGDFPDHLVPVGDVNGLTEALVRFAAATDLEALRASLRRSITERFSPEVIAARWEELLS